MKQSFFKKVFKLRLLASVTMLFGIMFLLHACSEDRADLDNNANESIELTDGNSMKLMVDGQFEKNIASIKDIEDGIYKYVIVNVEDESIVHAFTNENTFKNFENYDLVNSNMPGVNGNTTKILPDFNESEITAEIRKQRSTISTKNGDPNEINHILDFDWPDYSGGLVGHFDFITDYHLIIDLRTDTQANSLSTHANFSDIDTIYEIQGTGFLRYALADAEHIVIQNTNNALSILYLSTGTNNTGTTRAYLFPAHGGGQIPNGNYNSIRVVNY